MILIRADYTARPIFFESAVEEAWGCNFLGYHHCPVSAMSIYDLRSAFPLNNHEFAAQDQYWVCQLVEVSDLRPESDRLSWYLHFQSSSPKQPGSQESTRRLEIVTDANRVLHDHWQPDLADRISGWLETGGDDDRVEWLEG